MNKRSLSDEWSSWRQGEYGDEQEQRSLGGSNWLKSEETVALKTKRADFAAASLRGRMVVAGGLGHEPSALDSVEAFNPHKKKWECLAPMNFPRCSTSSIVIRDRLLVVGGVNQVPSSAHEILYVKEEEYL
ncbi:hypothetical protein CRENBAI_008243 [Crenichthys baileyi]|uniref:Uncharacterized protein n=1 Tax=Crenichthys baileyi TaxID=28760 RepID=A0AAV9QV27_9TELE